ncbi:MAG TPA: hypothetical protein VK593_08200 [Edaphobacter sp.]|nr:hypothetical protein [Edaphobacter sp.]
MNIDSMAGEAGCKGQPRDASAEDADGAVKGTEMPALLEIDVYGMSSKR